ncbi:MULTISPECIES: DUF4270 domain-containing protein [unclassified Lacinutrix]
MKKTIKALKVTSLLSFITLAFVACDKDFSTLESDIQGSQNFSTDSEKLSVITYNKKLAPVQTNGLSSNLLGVYKDPVYGITTANIVTQATLPTGSYDPDFGDSPELVSVILTIPYFSTLESTTDGESIYSMTAKDSLYNGDSEIKLSIYENGYFLKDFDSENVEEFQKYYSNANTTINFDNHIEATLLETDGSIDNPHFKPSPTEITITTGEGDDEEEEKLTPRFRKELNMPLNYWQNKFFAKEGMPELSNANNFKNYFRGLYFKAEAIGNNGNLILLDFSSATLELNYTNDSGEVDDDLNPIREDQTLQINLTGNRVNTFENVDIDNTIITADATANTVDGDKNLYLKGGEGSMAVIDLFDTADTDNNGMFDAYEDFIARYKDQRLINEANLVFYVDQEATADFTKDQEPNRVIIYDLKNNIPVVDYFIDITNSSDPEYSRDYHSTVLERDSDGNGVKYKIRLTEHLNNILLRDSMNLKLGLMVTTNVNEIFQYSSFESDDKVTSGTVMSPKGTVLHGGNPNVADEKRVQLEIFYTEPKN